MPYPYKINYTEVPGNCNIAYVDEGSGDRTLLFIHGLANYALCWRNNIEALRMEYRCIAIDLPGNGLSDKRPHTFSMGFFADTVNNFIETLGLKHVCLVGHSMGGQVAITTLLRHPHCAETMVLCAPAGLERFTPMDKVIYYSSMRFIEQLASDEMSLRKVIEHSFYLRNHESENLMIKDLVELQKTYQPGYYRKMVEACIKAMIEETVQDKLILISQPTLVIFGDHDALIPNRLLHHHTSTKKIAEEGVKHLQDAKLKMLPACGHFVQWEKAQVVNKLIHEFLEEL